MKMKLTFLGTGSAFTVNGGNYHSNMLLEAEGQRLLIDCGSDIRFSLTNAGFAYRDIQAVYISHLHADHTGGLEWLSFMTYMDKTCQKPRLYIEEELSERLWTHVLEGGLSSLDELQAKLSTYFEVHALKKGGQFEWQGIVFQLCQTIHMISNEILMPSFGLWIESPKKRLFITTDTRFVPERYQGLYKKADLIFHDCEISPVKTGVHAHYDELRTLPKEIKNKMWLYHYNPLPLPDAEADGFKGFVKCSQSFSFD